MLERERQGSTHVFRHFFFFFFRRDASLFPAIAVGEGGMRCSLLGPAEYRLCSFVSLASEQNHISSCSALLCSAAVQPRWLAQLQYEVLAQVFKHTSAARIDCFSVQNHSSGTQTAAGLLFGCYFLMLFFFHMLSCESAGFKLLG